jgi:hypothetical protein
MTAMHGPHVLFMNPIISHIKSNMNLMFYTSSCVGHIR